MNLGNIFWRMRNELGPFWQIYWLIQIFKSDLIFIIYYGFPTLRHGCKGYIPFATMTEGCKNGIFTELSLISNILENFLRSGFQNAIFMHLVTVEKIKEISFATMTHGCKEYFSLLTRNWLLQRGKFLGIFQLYLWKWVDFLNMYLPMI